MACESTQTVDELFVDRYKDGGGDRWRYEVSMEEPDRQKNDTIQSKC